MKFDVRNFKVNNRQTYLVQIYESIQTEYAFVKENKQIEYDPFSQGMSRFDESDNEDGLPRVTTTVELETP